MSKYQNITIFTKKGNLVPYMLSNPKQGGRSDSERKHYEREQDIRLILATRHERTAKETKLMCKISCPVNPLPVKGEFEAPSYGVIYEWLISQGWTRKEIISNHWFE